MNRIRQRSKKREALYRKRRPFVAKFLEEHPWCQRCSPYKVSSNEVLDPELVPAQRSTEVHEKQTRARGGDILDPENCVALCEQDHRWVHAHPRQATEEGWLRSGKRKLGA